MRENRVTRPGRGWTAVAVVSLMYMPMAALAMVPYTAPDPAALMSQLPDTGIKGYLQGALVDRTPSYQANMIALVSHTVTGSLLMLLGPYLLWTRPRRRERRHVIAGRLYLATVFASMTGSATYLVREPLEEAFTGPVFGLALWSILVGTILSAVLAWVSAVRHQIRMHVLWGCLNYGFLMTAPLLRIEWGLFGLIGVGETLEEASPQATINLVTITGTTAVLFALHLTDRMRPTAPLLGAAPTPSNGGGYARVLVLGSLAAGAVSLVVLVRRYLDHGDSATTHLAWFVVPLAVALAVVALLGRRASRAGRDALARDHLVLLFWLGLAPAIALVVSANVTHGALGLEPTIGDGAGVTVSVGYAMVFTLMTFHAISIWSARPGRKGLTGSRSRETSVAS